MAYADELTKKKLKEMGIKEVYWDEETQEWVIHRRWYRNTSKTIMDDYYWRGKITTKSHDKGKDKQYKTIVWYYKGKPFSTTISRIVKAWIKGRVRSGYVIDHRNNDSLVDDWKNLREKTIKANNRKRFKDNKGCKCFNQYKNTQKK